MALKSDRYEMQTDISFFYNAGIADRGGIACHAATVGVGASMDQGVNAVLYKTATSADVPVGILLNDVVNKDLTRTHLNIYRDEVQIGGKVTLLRKGYVVTNKIDGNPTGGSVAYASAAVAGNIASSGNAKLVIGRFLTSKDADGYAKVEVNLPTTA